MAWKVLEVDRSQSITDYTAAANSIDGVLIRVGYRGYGTSGTLTIDSKFSTYYSGFKSTNTKIGFYWFTTAVNVNEAVEEANYVYNNIKDKVSDFPVYIHTDYSNATHDGRSDFLSKSERTAIIVAFCDRLIELGYRAGVLAYDSWYDLELDLETLYAKEYSLIVARHTEDPPEYVAAYDAWEYTDTGSISGYSNDVTLSNFYTDVAAWSIPDPDVPVTDPIDINEFTIVISPAVNTYTGEEITPVVLISGLRLGIDFLVSYANNVEIGTANITITGINNYTGIANKNFVIDPQPLPGNHSIEYNPMEYKYIGEPIIPHYYIYELTEGTDYIIEFSNNIEIGYEALGTATGINNYTGTIYKNFTITVGSIEELGEFKLESDTIIYTGEEIEPKVIPPKDNLVFNVDYIVEYEDNIEIGTARAIIKGINKYSGTVILTFRIVKASITGKIVLDPPTSVYSGNECCPTVTIRGLEEGVDFEVSYINNINAGTATVIARGINNYSGQIVSLFKIYPRPISEMGVPETLPDQYYNAGFVEPPITIKGLTKGIDYVIRYGKNNVVGSAYVNVTGVGNYKDTVKVPFNIIECPITETLVKYGYASLYTPYRIDNGQLLITKDKYTLKEGKDYKVLSKEINRTTRVDFKIVTLTISGLGGFVDVATYSYRMIDIEPDPATYFDDGVYNFGDIDLGDQTAYGNYDFGDIDHGYYTHTAADYKFSHNPTEWQLQCIVAAAISKYEQLAMDDEPTVAEGDYNFEKLSGIYLDEYDEDDGREINPDGTPRYEWPPDDFLWNFEDLDDPDNPDEPSLADGDYDFGDLDEGRSVDSVIKDGDNYDFNIFTEGYPAGKEYELEDTPIYAHYSSTASEENKTGSYVIYKSQIVNDRIRITKMDNGVEAPVRCTGWVNIEDLDRLGKPKLGDHVYVTGALRRYINSETETIIVKNKLMYVVQIADEKEYECPYGVAYDDNSNRIGWADLEMLTPYSDDDE